MSLNMVVVQIQKSATIVGDTQHPRSVMNCFLNSSQRTAHSSTVVVVASARVLELY